MKLKTFLLTLIVVIVIGIGGASLMLIQSMRSDVSMNPSPTPSSSPTGRIQRSIAGSLWRYSIDTQAESKFEIKVVASPGSKQSILTISGRGCNAMSATVTTTKTEAGSRSRQLSEQIFYLNEPVSTLMACTGEQQNYDTQLNAEIVAIFNSLELSTQ